MPGRSRCPTLSASRWGRWRADRYAVCGSGNEFVRSLAGQFALTTGLLPAWRLRATPARLAQTFFASGRGFLQAGATGARSFTRRRRDRKARQRVGAARDVSHNRGKLTRRNAERVWSVECETQAGAWSGVGTAPPHTLSPAAARGPRPVAVVTITVEAINASNAR